jgi:hypothetical protein
VTDEQKPKPLGRVEIARAISEALTAALDPTVTGKALVARLRRIADRIETHLNGGVPVAPKAKKTKREKPQVPQDQVGALFDFWRTTMDHPDAIFTPGRRKVIVDRLRDGYSPPVLRSAIVGCSRTAFNMGMDPRHMGKRHDDLTLIFRNGENVERFADNAGAPPVIGGARAKSDDYDPRQHGDQGHLGGEYARKWNLFVDVGAERYEREWAKRSGA